MALFATSVCCSEGLSIVARAVQREQGLRPRLEAVIPVCVSGLDVMSFHVENRVSWRKIGNLSVRT